MEKGKIAMIGFSRFSLFPIKENTTSKYEVGERIDLPWVQEMTKEPDTSESKIYGDDGLYATISAWNGLNSTITLLEMPLEMHETLGFGTYDAATNTLSWNPQSKNLEFAVTFRCLQLNGQYRMYRMFSFNVTQLKDSGIKTKGDGTQVNTYQLIGTFTTRKLDDLPAQIHEGTDMAWLDDMASDGEIETETP